MSPIQYAEQICYSSKEVLRFSYDMAVKFKDSPGCFVECGTAAGAQVIAMSYGAPNKTIYAFDSFEGIPLPSNRDDQMPGIKRLKDWEQRALPDPGKQVLETTGATAVTMESFLTHIKDSGVSYMNVIPVKGWFEKTLIGLDMPAIAILRLDGDLYNSTWVCLQHLFPKVIKGGCVIVDDIQLKGCADACKEYFDLIGYTPDYKYIDNVAYFFK